MEKAKLAEKGSRLYTRTLVDYLIKLRGEKSQYTPINVRGVIFNSLGVFLSIGLIVFLSNLYTLPLLVPSLVQQPYYYIQPGIPQCPNPEI
ncbi:hypothetical protein N752_22880 [Desulforamulus aquiferis]|nr:hypothetical protein [Desulforamulus aquiferis]RYD02860.1 hypothetical protein N752_22880 [Desulforamulus aquiferis]